MIKILMIKGQSGFQDIFQRKLSEGGYLCTKISCDDDFRKILKEKHFDVVFIQVNSQKSDVQKLKEFHQMYPLIPVIICGNIKNIEETVAYFDNGASDCITLECSGGELVARVRAVIRRSQRRRV